jgi:PAS domain-containing protein
MRERPGEIHAPEPTEALAALVAKLRTELTGVRTAMRNRAVIEQAKGVLVERLGITPDESFDHLVRLSQRANIKLIEVAAAIVGTTAPDPQAMPVTDLADEELRAHVNRTRGRADGLARPARTGGPVKPGRPGDGRAKPARPGDGSGPARRSNRPPAHEALQAQHQLISSRVAASTTFDEVAEVIGTATASWPEPAVVVITLLEPTGAHRFVGTHGVTTHERTSWARVPPHVDVPVVRAAQDRSSLLVTDPDTLAERFPVVADLEYGTGAIFAAPLLDDDRVIGSLGLSWRERIDLDENGRRYLSALAAPVARKAAELAGRALGTAVAGQDEDPATWLPIVLETVPDPAAVLAPVWENGQVVDFRVEYANAPATELLSPARAGEDATLLAVYPRIGSELLLPRLTELLHTGGPQRVGPTRLGAPAAGRATAQVMTAHAGRVWDRVVLVWRVHDESELIHPQLLDAERIARIGSFRWDLESAEPTCSPQLYRMYHGDPHNGDGQPRPIRAGDLADCAHEDDLPAVQEAVHRTLVGGEQLSWEFRGAGALAGRRLRIVAEPEVDAEGTVVAVRGTVQDVTDERALEARLRLAEEALTAQRRRVDAELHAAQALQRALLPNEPELGATEGLWIAGRGRTSDHSGRVNGDWYDACALPDGVSLLVVGDVAGSGLAAMTAAARLRYAVRSYAALDMSPGEILAAVNTMLCALEPERTATLVVARYEALDHRLRWAVAGQAAPVRYRRDGRAELLAGPLGLPVGVAAQVTYEDTAVELASGDRLLLYTDSLVGARGTDLVSAIDVVLGAGAHAGRDDVEAVVSHVVDSLHVGPDADMGAMLVRVSS